MSTPTAILRAQLLGARASLDAALALLGEPEPEDEAPAGVCTHPPAKRKPAPVAGDLGQFHCTACHVIVSARAVPDAP